MPYNRLVIILTLIVPLTHILLPLSSEAQLVNSSTPAAIIQQKYFNQILNHLVYLMQIGRLDGGNGLILYRDVNPSYDDTGRYCAQGQSGPVWFLTGTYKHPADRNCTIPSGKAILFTILNSECSFAEFPNLKSEEQLRQCAKQMQDSVVHLEASVNGISLTSLEKYRIQSPLFNFTIPHDNVLGLPPQTTQAVSDGNWIFLKPLPVGNHTIYFKGGLKNVTDSRSHAFAGPIGWDYPNTYHITVGGNDTSI
ncbi:MAG TPA: hypothetical protein VE548_04775 [Nitrososphaeraceae archaeon]|nr:hypothetical protein [Nitrososphaeraceae archaeon]